MNNDTIRKRSIAVNRTSIDFDDALGSTRTDKRVEILRSIYQFGSISEAARANGVSYKAAWQAVETLGNLAGVPLLEKLVGGSGGGGARLTAEGLQVLEAADLLSAAREEALRKIRSGGKSPSAKLRNIAGLALRTSMRNQLPCIVEKIIKVQGAAHVQLDIDRSQRLLSRITLESLQLLELKKGMPVLALCKATAVTIAPTIVGIGEVNLLRGKVSRRVGNKADRQVSLELPSGLQIAGFVQADSDLKPKQAAMAAIDASAVVIGLVS
jgi:molybdate transport system regulatory protein